MSETKTLQVEFLELVRLRGADYEKGDIKTFRDPEVITTVGEFIAAGLCRDMAGVIPTGERKVARPATDLEVE